jgi:hypothetical protein
MEILLLFLGLIDRLITIPLACLFAKLDYINLLKKLELGVFFFCWRQSLLAESEGLPIAFYLKQQAMGEYGHAQYFCNLEGVKLKLSASDLFDREKKKAYSWGRVDWDTLESYQADGLSTKYLSTRVFFGNKLASDFDWFDKLAFMAVLESFQSAFYEEMLGHCKPQHHDGFQAIAEEELGHVGILEHCLSLLPKNKFYSLLLKWHLRKYLALLFVPIDLLILSINYEQRR